MVMGRVTEQFGQQGFDTGGFDATYRTYRQLRLDLEADPEAPQGLSLFLSHTLARAGLKLGRRVPVAGALLELVDENSLANQIGHLQKYVTRKIKNRDDLQLVASPLEVLTPLFLSTLADYAESRRIDLFFDTYEQTSSFLDLWLRDLLDGTYGEVSAAVSWSIAGRDEFDRNDWTAYDNLIAYFLLEPFCETEVREYLLARNVTDEAIVKSIIDLTGGLPLLVATLASENPSRTVALENPNDTAVDRFLKWVDDPKRRAIAVDTSLPRAFNKDIMLTINADADSAAFEWLKTMPFVRQRGETWIYHDVVRGHLVRKKRLESPSEWRTAHSTLAEFFARLCRSLEVPSGVPKYTVAWQGYRLEELYHRLCESPQGWTTFALNGFMAAFAVRKDFGRRWAATIGAAGHDCQVGELTEWADRLALIAGGGELPRAVESLTELIDTGELEQRWLSSALSRRALGKILLGRQSEATADIAKALEEGSDFDEVLVNAAVVALLTGRPEEAIARLERAGAVNRDNSSVAFGLSLAHLLIGDIEKARMFLLGADDSEESFVTSIDQLIDYLEVLKGGGIDNLAKRLVALSDLDIFDDNFKEAWKNARPLMDSMLGYYLPSMASKLGADELSSDEVLETARGSAEAFARQFLEDPDSARRMLQRLDLEASVIRYQLADDLENALEAQTRAIELSPGDAQVLMRRAALYAAQERFDEALADFDSAMALSPELPKGWQMQRGLLLSYLGRFVEASDSYKLFLVDDPENVKAIYNIAVATVRAYGFDQAVNEVSRARATLTKLLDSDERYIALYGLGGLEALGGNASAALDYLQEADMLHDEVQGWARHDVAWESVRGDARFKVLVAERGGTEPS